MIQKERLQCLKERPSPEGDYVLYWMQAAQRGDDNHALEYAIQKANELRKPLLVFFVLTEHFPEANARHYLFLLEGLKETQETLRQRGIKLVVQQTKPIKGAVEMARRAIFLVTDRGYLRIQRRWREEVAKQVSCPFWQVETETVVPVESTSDHEEYSAYTIRLKIKKHLSRYLTPLLPTELHYPSLHFPAFTGELDLSSPEKVLASLSVDQSVPPLPNQGGAKQARKKLQEFIEKKLPHYAHFRNDPSQDVLSAMSPYLHFGQISPLTIAQEIIDAPVKPEAKEAYLEELIVRRELAINFVFYNPFYDSFQCLPSWAQETFRQHQRDPRPYRYKEEEFEEARTHDPLWNAAQKELLCHGKIHGYVRMYWGKKIIEWSEDPEEAYRIALYLNNRYALDGQDPNSFAGIAWCFGKHDRAFQEHPVFGKVRYMGQGTMQKKAIARGYIERIERM